MTQTDNTARLVALALTGILFATASTFAGASFAEAKAVRDYRPAKVERVPALEVMPVAAKGTPVIRTYRPVANASPVSATRGRH
jgi:hypothetical protein